MSEERDVCSICLEILDNGSEEGEEDEEDKKDEPVKTVRPCGHRFHVDCLQSLFEHRQFRNVNCPVCRGNISYRPQMIPPLELYIADEGLFNKPSVFLERDNLYNILGEDKMSIMMEGKGRLAGMTATQLKSLSAIGVFDPRIGDGLFRVLHPVTKVAITTQEEWDTLTPAIKSLIISNYLARMNILITLLNTQYKYFHTRCHKKLKQQDLVPGEDICSDIGATLKAFDTQLDFFMKKIKPDFDVETIRGSYRYNVKPKGMGTNSIAGFITPGFTSSIADYKAWGIPTSRGRISKSRRSKSKKVKKVKEK
jgi:hypothetical protein